MKIAFRYLLSVFTPYSKRFEQKDPLELGFFLLKPYSLSQRGRRSFGPAFVHISLRNARLSQRRRTDAHHHPNRPPARRRALTLVGLGCFSFNPVWSLLQGVIPAVLRQGLGRDGLRSEREKEGKERPSSSLRSVTKVGKDGHGSIVLFPPGKFPITLVTSEEYNPATVSQLLSEA